LDVRDFDFRLPAELIAQEPPSERGGSRMLVLDRATGGITHALVTALPDHLTAGDLLVLNNTRVFPARLLGRRVPSGGRVECLLLGQVEADRWEALMHPGQKLKQGAQVVFEGAHTLRAEVLERRYHGRRLVRLWTDDGTAVDDAVDAIGHVPLPPYIRRSDRGEDRERYQTVFARARGSVAAPTAGLHLTRRLLAACEARGVRIVEITLHIGYGTFQPVRVERVEDHHVAAERYDVGPEAADAINRALAEGRRIVAVGTTTTRALEAAAIPHGGLIRPGSGSADLFIYPGYQFRVVSGLFTNFHLPRSSLLMLVCAFSGREQVLAAYRAAVADGYRFYSYGDAMLIL
jgi:S-adenosylmethionine:tRNA ribosyltransferase-isomerase